MSNHAERTELLGQSQVNRLLPVLGQLSDSEDVLSANALHAVTVVGQSL
jgi:hypothetical protein